MEIKSVFHTLENYHTFPSLNRRSLRHFQHEYDKMQWSVFRSVVEWPGVGCVTCFVHTGTLVCLCVFMVSAHPAKRRQGH